MSRTYFLTICVIIFQHTGRIFIRYYAFYIYILKKSLYSKRRELNKVILRAVSYIVLLRCRLINNQHYAPYEHIYIYIYIPLFWPTAHRDDEKLSYKELDQPWTFIEEYYIYIYNEEKTLSKNMSRKVHMKGRQRSEFKI